MWVSVLKTGLSGQYRDMEMNPDNPNPVPCAFKDTNGQACEEPVHTDGLCYWHADTAAKNEPGLKQRLEEHARNGKPMRYFKLRKADLSDIDLVNRDHTRGYQLNHADLYRCNLRNAHLFGLDLSFSSLMKADLSGANLHRVNLEHTNLLGVKLEHAKIEGVQWGEKVRQEWQADHESDPLRQRQLYSEAEEIYRSIGRVMRNQGMVAELGRFFYREMATRRKQMPKPSFRRFISRFIDLFCGYGEKPLRILSVSLVGILCFALIYANTGLSYDNSILSLSSTHSLLENFNIMANALYFSVVTFTTLGYGDITPVGISRVAAATEAFAGSFTIALFVVTFVRRMTR